MIPGGHRQPPPPTALVGAAAAALRRACCSGKRGSINAGWLQRFWSALGILLRMPPKTPAPQDAAPAEAPPAVASADDADKNADFAPVNMELPDIQSKFAALYTNLEKEQRARC